MSFELVEDLEWAAATIIEDARHDYGEVRLQVFAFLGDRLCVAVVTPRGADLRVISFRKANKKEVKRYGKGTG